MARKSKPLDPDDWLNGGPIEEDETPEGGAGIVVTKSRLQTITGLAAATVDRAFANGAPVIGKGSRKQGWQINTADFFGWYVRHKVEELTDDPDKLSFEGAKAAKTNAEARLKEMQLARLEGQTITIEEAVALYREEATIIRSQLMAIPGRCAVLLASETDPTVIEAMIADEINIALSNITGDKPDTWTGESDDDRDRREDAERTNDGFDSESEHSV